MYGSNLCLYTAAKFIVEQYTLEVSFYYYKRATEWKQMSAYCGANLQRENSQ